MNTYQSIQKKVSFTELEQEIIDAFIPMLYAEAGFSDVDANDIAKEINRPIKIVRGALGSLVQKGVIFTYDNGRYVIIYLQEDFYYLHPNWSNENN